MDPFGYLMVYSNNEWIAYTWSSVHVHNNTVWDHKYPICVVENVLMNNPAVKKAFYKEFARFLAWHDDVAASGRFPTRGSQGLSKQLFRPYSGDDRVRAQGWGRGAQPWGGGHCCWSIYRCAIGAFLVILFSIIYSCLMFSSICV